MKIYVLQGINLKNPITTVVAEMEKCEPDLPEFFKDIHRVFMLDYKIVDGPKSKQTLEIQTHLPNFWKFPEIMQAIEDHATGKTTLEDAKKSMLEIANHMVKSMSTIPILQAAHQMGYETIQFYMNQGFIRTSKLLNRYYCIGIGKESAVTVSAASSGDSYLAKKTQQDKWLTNMFIEELDLPIAPWRFVETKAEIPAMAKEVGDFPMVMKPVGLTGGHAVFTGLNSVKELEEAWDKIKDHMASKPHLREKQGNIIIQKQVSGKDYRVLVINGKVEIATHRIPARVEGDGKHTIRELIEIENENPARDKSLPTHTLKPIVIDEELEKVVKENGYSLDDTPPNGEIVQVRNVASMSQGGITADVTDKLNPQIRFICESMAKSIHANVLGIDVLVEDITKPLTPENGSILEMNTMPEAYLNTHPVIGKQYPDTGKKILAGLIDPEVHTNRVVLIGDISKTERESIIQRNLDAPGRIGTYCEGRIFVDGHEINSDIETESAVLSLKKNRSLDTIVLHYREFNEVEQNGLGFNEIDLLVNKSGEKLEIDTSKILKIIA